MFYILLYCFNMDLYKHSKYKTHFIPKKKHLNTVKYIKITKETEYQAHIQHNKQYNNQRWTHNNMTCLYEEKRDIYIKCAINIKILIVTKLIHVNV